MAFKLVQQDLCKPAHTRTHALTQAPATHECTMHNLQRYQIRNRHLRKQQRENGKHGGCIVFAKRNAQILDLKRFQRGFPSFHVDSLIFLNVFFTSGLRQWDFFHENFRVAFPRGKPAATESRYPTYCACWVF